MNSTAGGERNLRSFIASCGFSSEYQRSTHLEAPDTASEPDSPARALRLGAEHAPDVACRVAVDVGAPDDVLRRDSTNKIMLSMYHPSGRQALAFPAKSLRKPQSIELSESHGGSATVAVCIESEGSVLNSWTCPLWPSLYPLSSLMIPSEPN
eukprot:695051-Rhodomonas_salina.5